MGESYRSYRDEEKDNLSKQMEQAMRENDLSAVCALLDIGAEPEYVGSNGISLLEDAKKNCSSLIYQALLADYEKNHIKL